MNIELVKTMVQAGAYITYRRNEVTMSDGEVAGTIAQNDIFKLLRQRVIKMCEWTNDFGDIEVIWIKA